MVELPHFQIQLACSANLVELACRIWCLRAALGWSALVGANEWFLASGWQWYSNRMAKGAGVFPSTFRAEVLAMVMVWLPFFFWEKGLGKSSRVDYGCSLALLILVNTTLPLFNLVLLETIAVIDDYFFWHRPIGIRLLRFDGLPVSPDKWHILGKQTSCFDIEYRASSHPPIVRVHPCCKPLLTLR